MPKISELTAATAITGSDTLAIVQGGDTKKIAASAVLQPFDIRHYGGGEAGLLAAIAAAEAAGGTVVGGTETITVTQTIVMNCSCELGGVTLNANGASVSPVLRLGTTSGAPTENLRCVLPTVRNTARTAGTWGAGIGVQCVNLYSSDISVGDTREFEIGVTFGGANSGFAYNVVRFFGRIYNNKINVRLMPTGTGGWCNQNTFIGGRLGLTTGVFSTSGYTGTRQLQIGHLESHSVGGPNTNTFIGTSLENNGAAVPEAMIDYVRSAKWNTFIGARFEGSNKNIFMSPDGANEIASNLILGGYFPHETTTTITPINGGTAQWNNRLSARRNVFQSDSYIFNLANTSSSNLGGPHLQGFQAGTSPYDKNQTTTDWQYRLYASGLSGKAEADDEARIRMTFTNGRFELGNGTDAPDWYMSHNAANLAALAPGDSLRVDGVWDGGMYLLGSYRLWVDGSGNPRIKSSAPASDTDGSIFITGNGQLIRTGPVTSGAPLTNVATGGEFRATSTTSGHIASVGTIVNDGSRNNRLQMYVNDTSNKLGLDFTFTTGGANFFISRAGVDKLEITNSRFIVSDDIALGASTGPRIINGAGDPNTVVSAPVGSLYVRTDGGAATTLYIKESGTGDTGWVAK